MNYNLIDIDKMKVADVNKTFRMLYDGSAMTVQGMRMDELDQYIELFQERCGLHDNCNIYHFTGGTYNKCYKLTGDNRYPEELNCISVELKDLDNCMGVRPMVRWFDDIVDNDKYRERNKH